MTDTRCVFSNDEFSQSETHVEDVIRWLDRHDKPDGRSSPSEPADIEQFQRAGWTVQKAETSIDPRIAEIRRRLDSDGNMALSDSAKPSPMWSEEYDPQTGQLTATGGEADGTPDDGDDPEHGSHVGLLLADTCRHLIREFLGYKTEHVGRGAATDHALDAARYAVTGGSSGEPTVIERSARSNVFHRSTRDRR